MAALASSIPPPPSVGSSLTVSPCFLKESDCNFSKPFCLPERPCEAVINRADEVLYIAKIKGKNPTGVSIEGLGSFTETSLRLLKKFCSISNSKNKLAAEAKWLSGLKWEKEGQLHLIQSVLWNKPPTSQVLSCNHKVIDVLSFSDLVEERCINSIEKYIEESYKQETDYTLYFPTEVFQLDGGLKQRLQTHENERENIKSTKNQCLTSIASCFQMNHWGLIYIIIIGKRLFLMMDFIVQCLH